MGHNNDYLRAGFFFVSGPPLQYGLGVPLKAMGVAKVACGFWVWDSRV